MHQLVGKKADAMPGGAAKAWTERLKIVLMLLPSALLALVIIPSYIVMLVLAVSRML